MCSILGYQNTPSYVIQEEYELENFVDYAYGYSVHNTLTEASLNCDES